MAKFFAHGPQALRKRFGASTMRQNRQCTTNRVDELEQDPALSASDSSLNLPIALQKDTITILKTIHEVSSHPGWRDAMIEEMVDLDRIGTWDLIDLLIGKKAIRCKWVFEVKVNLDGSPLISSICINFDIKNAFLHSDLQEEVYMEQLLRQMVGRLTGVDDGLRAFTRRCVGDEQKICDGIYGLYMPIVVARFQPKVGGSYGLEVTSSEELHLSLAMSYFPSPVVLPVIIRSLVFHDFVAKTLTKDPSLRPTASEMLKVW
ncbi:Cysteine-rich RLK (RECEPTOR-like protein kinase) 8 [Gossypium australe]|uniref:Cysteine-rich RLK (RECEPTOR-like protein kinase) 8 n=1 Tax=Gossypium australe TaxID=47621 RepID=A0A5B6WPG1_9ROSI|nr:Cysteine-rich RLK (RECEPTOR-like protein kinase) 8 [Gossypium australe]